MLQGRVNTILGNSRPYCMWQAVYVHPTLGGLIPQEPLIGYPFPTPDNHIHYLPGNAALRHRICKIWGDDIAYQLIPFDTRHS